MVNDMPGNRRIKTLVQMTSELHASIPFEHRVDVEPCVALFRPTLSQDEVAIVDMVIEHRLTQEDAMEQLRDAGFLEEESL
jgi:hypothetical protein